MNNQQQKSEEQNYIEIMDNSSNGNGINSNSGVNPNEVNIAMAMAGNKYVNSSPHSNYLTMSITESMKLLRLLSEWNMPYLHQTCVDSLVDVEALEYINPLQCEVLLSRFPMGIRVKFIGKLVVWKTHLHNYQMSIYKDYIRH